MRKHLNVDINKIRKKDFLQVQRSYEAKLQEIILSKHGLKTVSECPLCKSRDHAEELVKYNSPLLRCNECDLRFHKEIAADPKDVYHDPDHIIYPMDESFEEHFKYRVERFGRERAKLLAQYCGDLSAKKILDIGCGNGYCLTALKETGAQCVGAELSKKWAKFTSERTGLPVHNEPLESFPEKDFDIITLFDVIEHVEEPIPFVLAAKKLLKPKGRILFYTPNFDSFSIKVMGEFSNNICPFAHVILFSHKSFVYLAKRAGLEFIYSETRGLDIHSILAFQDYLGQSRDPFLAQWQPELQAMIDAAGCGDYIRVILENESE